MNIPECSNIYDSKKCELVDPQQLVHKLFFAIRNCGNFITVFFSYMEKFFPCIVVELKTWINVIEKFQKAQEKTLLTNWV